MGNLNLILKGLYNIMILKYMPGLNIAIIIMVFPLSNAKGVVKQEKFKSISNLHRNNLIKKSSG